MKHKRIIVASQPRCGSMWVWNVTRELIRAVDLRPIPGIIEADAEPGKEIAWALSAPLGPDEVACLKVHKFVDPLTSDCLVIGPWRDLYDASLSFMRFRAMPFGRYLLALNGPDGQCIAPFLHLYPQADIPNLLAIPYPDIVSNAASVVRRIARFIGADVDDCQVRQIVETWCPANVQRLIDRVVSTPGMSRPVPGQGHRVYDPVTGFSALHIGSGEAPALSAEEEAQLRNVIRGVLSRGAGRERKERKRS